MINAQTKARALGLLKQNKPPEQIATELELPTMLVKEWQSTMTPNDMEVLATNIAAIETVAREVAASDAAPEIKAKTIDLLKNKLEDTAFELAGEISSQIGFNDPIQAKSVELLTNSISKLYATFVIGHSGGNPEDPAGESLFAKLLKD